MVFHISSKKTRILFILSYRVDNIILEGILFYAGGEREGEGEHYNKKECDETEFWRFIIMISENISY